MTPAPSKAALRELIQGAIRDAAAHYQGSPLGKDYAALRDHPQWWLDSGLTDEDVEAVFETHLRLKEMADMAESSIGYGHSNGAVNWRSALEELRIKLNRRVAALGALLERHTL